MKMNGRFILVQFLTDFGIAEQGTHEASSVAPRLEGPGSLGKHAEELTRRTGGPGGVAAAGLV